MVEFWTTYKNHIIKNINTNKMLQHEKNVKYYCYKLSDYKKKEGVIVKNLKKKTKFDKSYLGLFIVEKVLNNNKYLICFQVNTFKVLVNFL
jgi:hypothetical protein